MKIRITIIFFAINCLVRFTAVAQVKMGLCGTRTNSVNSIASQDLGHSVSLSFFSAGDTVGKRKITFPLVVQFGGELYYSGLGKRTFYDVPLLAPQVGYSKVTLSNSLLCVNFLTRFSLPNKRIFTPYMDAFIGYRSTKSKLEVLPDVTGSQQTKTRQLLSTVDGLNYGMGLGVMVAIGTSVQLDLGVSYAQAFQNGGIADLSTAYADAGGINLDLKESPGTLRMFHVGLIFYIRKDGVSEKKGPSGSPTYYQNYQYRYYVPVRGRGFVCGTYISPYGNSKWNAYYHGAGRGYTRVRNGSGTGGGIKGSVPMGSNNNIGSSGGYRGGGSHVGVHVGGGHSGGGRK